MSMICPAYERCGACQGLRTPYSEQLARKREAVAQVFREADLRVRVQEVCGMEDPYHYRNKVIAAVSMQGGRVVCGLYEEYSHRVVPMEGCLLQDKRLNAVLATLTRLLNELKIKPFGYGGTLKHVLLRLADRTGQVLLVLVTSGELMHGRKELLARLRAACPEVATVVQNVQPRQTSVVLGPREKVLFGPGYIFDELLGRRYKISARSFYQVNPLQTERLYAKALSLAALRPGDTLMDAYCGIGTIGLSATSGAASQGQNGPICPSPAGIEGSQGQNGLICPSQAGIKGSQGQNGPICPSQAGKDADVRIIGVEINRDAVQDAIANARANGVRNARFYCADVSAFMREFDAPVDVLMLDPPRAGCDEEFLRAVLQMAPRRIVYVSCNPATQARDVAFLLRASAPARPRHNNAVRNPRPARGPQYVLNPEAWPFDLFPHTSHVENIVCLEQIKP